MLLKILMKYSISCSAITISKTVEKTDKMVSALNVLFI